MNNGSLFCIALKLLSVDSRNGTRMALLDWSTDPFVKVLRKTINNDFCVYTEKENKATLNTKLNIFQTTQEFNVK